MLEKMRITKILTLTVAMLTVSSASLAQTATGTIAGRVTDPSGAIVAAASVTIQSASLQGVARTTTSANGDYIFKLLPPGSYTVTVSAPGFEASKSNVSVGGMTAVDGSVALRAAGVRENVTVTADSEPVSTAEVVNIKSSTVDALPLTRSLLSYLTLAPAAHATGPEGYVSIAGAMSFENLYLIDGVATQDNVRRKPLDLYIEDAIQETTIRTSRVSAEYGRFIGGVVNAVTRSGGNIYGGSYRTTFTNDNWRSTTPFGEPKDSKVVPSYEVTLGGPIVKDKTWFFAAGRVDNESRLQETAISRLPYTYKLNESRFQAKVTQSLSMGQRLQVGVAGIAREETNVAGAVFSDVMDVKSLKTRELPERNISASYQGAFGSRFFLESQYTRRTMTFRGDGGMSTDRILGTPLVDNMTGLSWWAPAFCGVCRNEERNNDEILIKGSTFASTRHGSHDIVFGYDTFNDRVVADNYQSATDYHVWATASFVDNGVVYPVIEPGFSTYIIHWPLLESTNGTNFRTHAFFVQDAWRANGRLTLDLGVRYDKNSGRDASNHLVSDGTLLSPRIAATFDPFGAGRTTISGSYGRYSAALANGIANGGSGAGLTGILAYFYEGAPINADPSAPLVPTEVALQRVFEWFDQANPDPFQVTIPGVQRQIRASLKSPDANEWTAGVRHRVTDEATVGVTFIDRRFGNFYADRTDVSTGQIGDDVGNLYDLTLIENTDAVSRRYTGVVVDASVRLDADTMIGANYTMSKLRGNIEGESFSSGPVANGVLNYPEFSDIGWSRPVGALSADQRHRVRLWGTFLMPLSTNDSVSLGVLQQIESGTPYGASAGVQLSDFNGHPYVEDPGYLSAPQTATYFFTARDAFRTETMWRTDVAVSYRRRLSSRTTTEVFAQAQLLNVFNRFQAFNNTNGQINTTVLTAANAPGDYLPFNPFTETPVEGVNWDYGPDFGKPVSAGVYTTPRTFRFSAGLRF